MADDAQFDPLAGILTPQQLQLMRIQQMQQAMAAANGPDVPGLQAAAKSAGLALGSGLGSAGPDASLAGRIAQQNQTILSAPPPDQGGGPAPTDPYEARAQAYEQKAKLFLQAGQYDTAQKFINAAQIVRKQSADMEKSRADTYQAYGKGMDARANMNDVKPALRPDGTFGYASVPKVGGEATPITGVSAPPPVPATSITMKEGQPFLSQFAASTGKAGDAANEAVQALGIIKDMRTRLEQGIISGSAADTRTQLGSALQTMGFQKAPANNPVANTQAYAAEAMQLALQLRPSGTRLTQVEWGWLTKAAAGDTNIPIEGLRQILNAREKIAQGAITKYNTMSGRLQTIAKSKPNSELSDAATLYGPMEIPSAAPDKSADVAAAAPKVFATEADAKAANLADGTPVVVGGVKGKWKHK